MLNLARSCSATCKAVSVSASHSNTDSTGNRFPIPFKNHARGLESQSKEFEVAFTHFTPSLKSSDRHRAYGSPTCEVRLGPVQQSACCAALSRFYQLNLRF